MGADLPPRDVAYGEDEVAAAVDALLPAVEIGDIDLPNTRIDLTFNGEFVKSGYGRAAMGHPLTSLTWLANWLRERGRGLMAGEIVSTGTCTGHFFAAPGDHLTVDFGDVGTVELTYE